jgi:hypothetical protein
LLDKFPGDGAHVLMMSICSASNVRWIKLAAERITGAKCPVPGYDPKG